MWRTVIWGDADVGGWRQAKTMVAQAIPGLAPVTRTVFPVRFVLDCNVKIRSFFGW